MKTGFIKKALERNSSSQGCYIGSTMAFYNEPSFQAVSPSFDKKRNDLNMQEEMVQMILILKTKTKDSMTTHFNVCE
jgi:hypothetical protein